MICTVPYEEKRLFQNRLVTDDFLEDDQILSLWEDYAWNESEDMTVERRNCQKIPGFMIKNTMEDKIDSLSLSDDERRTKFGFTIIVFQRRKRSFHK